MADLMNILAKSAMKVPANTVVSVPAGSWYPLPLSETVFSRGDAIQPDPSAWCFNILKAGPYSFDVSVNAAFNRQAELRLIAQINSSPVGEYLAHQGHGNNKPLFFAWSGIHEFQAGDQLFFMLQMEDNDTDVNILAAHVIVAKEF